MVESREEPILKSSAKIAGQRLLRATVALYEHYILIEGWGWRGKYEKKIILSEIDHIEWRSESEQMNFWIYLKSGKHFPMLLRGAGLWKYTLNERLKKENALATEEDVARSTAA